MMAAVVTYVKAFIDGEFDSFTTHCILIGVIALAEISLAVGIWLESPKDKHFREWCGLATVFVGCIISAVFTVLLLVFDEGISRGQSAELKQAKVQLGQAITIAANTNERANILERATEAQKAENLALENN
jgi:hypothetical protein